MKKFVVVVCSVVLAFGLAGCWGKAPVGKGKAPVVQTRGWSDSSGRYSGNGDRLRGGLFFWRSGRDCRDTSSYRFLDGVWNSRRGCTFISGAFEGGDEAARLHQGFDWGSYGEL